jgi:Beta-galactosidase, galactose-binding domain
VWWQCKLSKPKLPSPAYLVTQRLSKGQAYLNGIPLGRYWEIGPQHAIYLPEPWFREQNVLAIFDEEGRPPNQNYIVRDLRYPTRKVMA